MTTVSRFVLNAMVVLTACGGCARKSETSAPQDWAFETEKVWELRQLGEDELLRPAEPRVADDGTLYIHDFDRHLSYIVDGDGTLVGTFAPRGSGEGEVPMYINCFPAGDHVVICALDMLHFFTREGQFVKTVPNNPFVRFPLAFKNENQFWVAPGALGDSPGDSAVVTEIDLASGEETTVHTFTLTADESKPTGGALVFGLTPQAKMGFDPEAERIYFGKNSDTVIYRLDAGRDQAASFSFAGVSRPVSAEAKRDHFAGHNIPEDAVASIIGALPDRMTQYNRLQVVDGLVYLLTSESIGGGLTGQTVNVFDPDGRHLYVGQIRVEAGWRVAGSPDNLQLARGFVYAVLENDAGEKKIVKYRVSLPTL